MEVRPFQTSAETQGYCIKKLPFQKLAEYPRYWPVQGGAYIATSELLVPAGQKEQARSGTL